MNVRRVQFTINILVILMAICSLWLKSIAFPILIIVLEVFSAYLLLKKRVKKSPVIRYEESKTCDVFEPPIIGDDNECLDVNNEKDTIIDFALPEDFDEKKFARDIFELYKDIQTNFMNFGYDDLIKELGIELYEQFFKQMKRLEESSKQSVRTNIELLNVEVVNYDSTKNAEYATVQLSVLEDKYLKKIDDPFRLTSSKVRYESSYTLEVIKNHHKSNLKKCPFCGEKIISNDLKCHECHNFINEVENIWILKNIKLVCSHSYKSSKTSGTKR